jgi:hypothetical protein
MSDGRRKEGLGLGLGEKREKKKIGVYFFQSRTSSDAKNNI